MADDQVKFFFTIRAPFYDIHWTGDSFYAGEMNSHLNIGFFSFFIPFT